MLPFCGRKNHRTPRPPITRCDSTCGATKVEAALWLSLDLVAYPCLMRIQLQCPHCLTL